VDRLQEKVIYNAKLFDGAHKELCLAEAEIDDLEKAIESLTKERDDLRRKNNVYVIFDTNGLGEKIEKLTEERDQLWKCLGEGGRSLIEKANKLKSERDEYLEIVNKYEEAQGRGIQTIIEQNIKLEARTIQLKECINELSKHVSQEVMKDLEQLYDLKEQL